MIVYHETCRGFRDHVLNNNIEDIILEGVKSALGHSVSPNEIKSWSNSLIQMNNALLASETPDDAGVAIEYVIPSTSKRVDFLLSGLNDQKQETVVIVELKQWEKVSATTTPSVVNTFLGGRQRNTVHPSYQAWSYKKFIQDYNTEVQESKIHLVPCSYLHNCRSPEEITSNFYRDDLEKARLFGKRQAPQLHEFLSDNISDGDNTGIIKRIENAPLRPSKQLVEYLKLLLDRNEEFTLIDEQKVIFETALHFARIANQSDSSTKQVMLIDGGPGTGKSVLAINLLVQLTAQGLVAQYVTRNSAPREVFQAMLEKSLTKKTIGSLFKSSGSYTKSPLGSVDALIVDEAHRLTEKTGIFKQGDNQVKEIIKSSNFSIFFIDEDQQIRWDDFGDKDEIRTQANKFNAEVHELQLESQFRCNGSDGYLSWLDNTLGIRDTANPTLDHIDYDFRVFDCPNSLRQSIVSHHKKPSKARMVAGYCWDWKSKSENDLSIMDVKIPEYGFEMQWNLVEDGQSWIIRPNSIEQIGCIHTCQGLELDYVGVIIGKDFVVRKGTVKTDALKRAKTDHSIWGYKKLLKENEKEARKKADRIIKNTYRTLMTRGQKGCYIFCVDPETNQYFKDFVLNRNDH